MSRFKVGDKVVIRKGDHHVVSETLVDRPFVTIAEVIHDGQYFRVEEGFAAHPTHSMAEFRFVGLYTEPVKIKAGTQLAKVYDLTKSGSHWTLGDISRLTQASEAAASARLRDLRALGLDVKCHKHKGEKVRTYTVQPKEVATA